MTSFGSVDVLQTFAPLLVVHNDPLVEMGSKVDLVLLLGVAVQGKPGTSRGNQRV